MMKENEEKVKYFTQVEMKKVFRSIEKDSSIHSLRNLAIFRVAYRCALRASEAGLIHLEDYNKRPEGKYTATGLKEAIITP